MTVRREAACAEKAYGDREAPGAGRREPEYHGILNRTIPLGGAMEGSREGDALTR
jgi:hypothetical protein